MEHPVKDIRPLIKTLTQGTPGEQEAALKANFLPEATFVHPFCRVPSFQGYQIPLVGWVVDSRWVILMIYRWYRILSPDIEIEINSAVFDQKTNYLYLHMTQTFTYFFLPIYHANVTLITLLALEQRGLRPDGVALPAANGEGDPANNNHASRRGVPVRYFVSSQEDRYQVSEFLKFVVPVLGAPLWAVWQVSAALICVLGALILAPVSWLDVRMGKGGKKNE